MKYSILLTFCMWTLCSFGQVNGSMLPEASIFYNKAIDIISPEIKKVVLVNSLIVRERKLETEQLLLELHQEPRLRKFKKPDLEWIAILVLVQASKNADDELKKKVVELRKNPGEEATEEIKRLSEFKSFLATNTTQLLGSTTISQENALNNLKP